VGLDMYQTLRDSKIGLNCHADSSPTYASNFRLFEVTGVGSCLLTDWKRNLPELFDPDSEVVAYHSIPECLEKIRWLRDHDAERRKIAEAGQRRCLRDHTHEKRAPVFADIIENALKRHYSL
jgi:spore maturation protein CgeB